MFANNLYLTIKKCMNRRLVRRTVQRLSRTWFGGVAAALFLSSLSHQRRRAAAFHLMGLLKSVPEQESLCQRARMVAGWRRSQGTAETFWLMLGFSSRAGHAAASLASDAFKSDLRSHNQSANLYIAAACINYSAGSYRDAVRDFEKARNLEAEVLTGNGFGLRAAYGNGHLLNLGKAKENFARYYQYIDLIETFDEAAELRFDAAFMERTCVPLLPRLVLELAAARGKHGRYGVFFHSSTEALGHAVIDPYYFLALNRETYDHVFFLGPGRSSYRPASTIGLRMVEQYGQHLELQDETLLNASWMHFGKVTNGAVDLCVDHYWSLLRTAVHRTRDQNDPFEHNAWHLTLPASIERNGRAFAEMAGIHPDAPLVVLHARHHAYHNLGGQSYRDTNIENYVPAVRHLLKKGYQVVRLGDVQMPRLAISESGYFELPFLAGYRPEIDPYFISHATFMIGCQSGPCAYARALGVPLLSINAVLHFSLLPAPKEMGCFKRYQRIQGSDWLDMSLIEALAADVQSFDNSYQFETAGIRVVDASADEILASIDDMLDWLSDPQRPMSPEQSTFFDAVEAKCCELSAISAELDKPIADYLGIALPGYRLSPTVARMRGEPVSRVENKSQTGQET